MRLKSVKKPLFIISSLGSLFLSLLMTEGYQTMGALGALLGYSLGAVQEVGPLLAGKGGKRAPKQPSTLRPKLAQKWENMKSYSTGEQSFKEVYAHRVEMHKGKGWTEASIVVPGNKGFYNPHAMKQMVAERYSGDMRYSTVPDLSHPNVRLAGKRYEIKIGQTQKARDIVFDHKGYPTFDKHTVYDMRLPKEVFSVENRALHMRTATKELSKQIQMGKVDRSIFTKAQLQDIAVGKENIKGLTWHHHQDIGRMQLIPSDIHKAVRHVGGMKIWY